MSNVHGVNWEKHAFKIWVDQVVNKHFSPSIAKRFYGVFEVEKYNKNNKNIIRQLKDNKYVMEVYYTQPSGLHVYICDLFSDWKREFIEYVLLVRIKEKLKNGSIGQDWGDIDGKVSVVINADTKGVKILRV